MFKKVISYTDFNDKPQSKAFYFNLTRPELLEMKRSPIYELKELAERTKDMENPDEELSYKEKDDIQERLGDMLRGLVIQSYGVKSEDGERFVKRIGSRRYGEGEDFVETMAYDALYMELMSDINNLVSFVRAIIPSELRSNFDSAPEIQQLGKAEGNIVSIAKDTAT